MTDVIVTPVVLPVASVIAGLPAIVPRLAEKVTVWPACTAPFLVQLIVIACVAPRLMSEFASGVKVKLSALTVST